MADTSADAMLALQNSLNKLTEQIRNMPTNERRQTPNVEKQRKDTEDPKVKREQDRRTEKALQDLNKNLKDSYKSQATYGTDLKLTSKVFENAVKSANSKMYDQIPAKITALTKGIGLEFKTKSDIDKALNKYSLENINAAKELKEQFDTLTVGTKQYDAVLNKISKRGFTDVSELSQSHQELIGTGTTLGKAVNSVSKELVTSTSRLGTFSSAVTWGKIQLLALGGVLVNTIAINQKYNTNLLSSLEGMAALGMSGEAYGKLQADNMQAIHASAESMQDLNESMQDFTHDLVSGSWGLLGFTGSLEAGARLQASLMAQSRKITASGVSEEAYKQTSLKTFKEMNSVFGTTAEQFQALNEQVTNTSAAQENLYRVTAAQRGQVAAGMVQNVEYLQTQGLLQEQAKGLVDMFQEMNAQSPKNRRKQAAEIAAVGGAIGLGPQAQELAELIRRGARTHEEQHRQVELEAQIQAKAQAKYAATAPGGAAETVLYELTNRAGLGGVFAQKGAAAGLGTQQGLAIDQKKANELIATKQDETNSKFDKVEQILTGVNGILQNMFGGGIIKTFTAMWVIGKGLNLFGNFLKGGSKVATIAEGTVGAEGAVAAGAVATTLAAGGMITTLATAAFSLWDAYHGKDASNWISKLDDQYLGLGGKITDELSKRLGPNEPAMQTFRNYSKDPQVQAKIAEMDKDRKEGKTKEADALQQLINIMVKKMAVDDKRNPDKAVDSLHKTIIKQHEENKQMTQDQTDAVKDSKKAARLTKTGSPG
jgi:hypothetical protein